MTYNRETTFSTIDNKNLKFKLLAVVFKQSVDLTHVTNFEEIDAKQLFPNVSFSSFYRSDHTLDTIKNSDNFTNQNDEVLNIIDNEDIPRNGSELNIKQFINSKQYIFSTITLNTNVNNYNIDSTNSIYNTLSKVNIIKIIINSTINSTNYTNPALILNVDSLYSTLINLKYLFMYVNGQIKGANGIGGNTYGNGRTTTNNISYQNGGNGQDGTSGGDAIKIISNIQRSNLLNIYIIKSSIGQIIKGYGANGGTGGNAGRNYASATYEPTTPAYTSYQLTEIAYRSYYTPGTLGWINLYVIKKGCFITDTTTWFFWNYEDLADGSNAKRAFVHGTSTTARYLNTFNVLGKDSSLYVTPIGNGVGILVTKKHFQYSDGITGEAVDTYGTVYDIGFVEEINNPEVPGEEILPMQTAISATIGNNAIVFGAPGYNFGASGTASNGSQITGRAGTFGNPGFGGKHGTHGEEINITDSTNIEYFDS